MKLQSILQAYRPAYEARYGAVTTPEQWSALYAMLGCRTTQYGTLSLHCEHCDWHGWRALSCGHRACAQCHQHSNALWSERQCLKLLPVPYFMLTFTLPRELHPLAKVHGQAVYAILFGAAIKTLHTFGCNDPHLQAEPAATALLHTHSRRLDYHPHVHLIVPGGVLDTDTREWRTVKAAYLVNHFNLARVFRAIFLKNLQQAGLAIPDNPKKRVAHCKPVGEGTQAIQYLSRYLYRGVLSESQLVADDGNQVTFRYKDSQTGKRRTRTVRGETLLRLLLLHVLPKGFRRTRDYGFLHGNAKRRLQLLQYLLKIALPPAKPRERAKLNCPCCNAIARIIGFIKPHQGIRLQPG
jgi:hypothetical protein